MYLTIGTTHGKRVADCVMDTVRTMVKQLEGAVRSMESNLDATQHQKRAAPVLTTCDDHVAYYRTMGEVGKTAKRAKVTLNITATERDRASDSLRLTFRGSHPRALAMVDGYQTMEV